METYESYEERPNIPIGVILIEKLGCRKLSSNTRSFCYRWFILVMTFLAYAAFHMSRRPLSVVKNVLNRDCAEILPPPGLNITNATRLTWCNWEPFTGSNANQLLGYLDSCFLFTYAIFMFVSGVVAERVNLRLFLSLGLLLSGLFTYLFGLAHALNIHSYIYFVAIQILGGAAQSSGWPTVVACLGNWFGKSRRGLIFGIWNSHLYLGNILGAYVAGVFVATNWGYSFLVPSVVVGVMGILTYLFLVPQPEDLLCSIPDTVIEPPPTTESMSLLKSSASSASMHEHKEAITFWAALKIPGVMEFSACLFFAKLVSYTFLFWLPKYINSTTNMDSEGSAYLSVPFDVGGIIGGILAGILSDRSGASAITCKIFLFLAIPSLFLYDQYGAINTYGNIALQILCGALVNGPYALITTAVAAELGTHKSVRDNAKALATVTAIIDGTGSFGAAVGPLLAGVVSEKGWKNVFYMMMVSDFLALLAISRVAYREGKRIFRRNAWCCYS